MNDNEKTVGDLTSTVFSFLSLKVKLIIIGVILGLFFIILIPVIAISAVTGGIGEDADSSISSSEANATSEVIGSDKLYQYANSKFAIPFEVWNPSKDVVTSKFSKSRTITVNRTNTN